MVINIEDLFKILFSKVTNRFSFIILFMRKRNFLKSIGAVAMSGAALTPAITTANSGGDYTTTDEIGVTNEVRKLLMRRKVGEAKALLEKENIKHSFSNVRESQQSLTNNSSDDVGTEDFLRDEMIANCGLIHKSGDIYTLWGDVAAFEDAIGSHRWRQDWVPDVVGFSANSSVWSPNDASRSHLSISVPHNDHEVTMDEYDEEDGVACKVDLDSWDSPPGKPKEMVISLSTTIEHIGDSETQPVSIVYRHTSGRTPWGSIKSIDIGSLLGLSLSLGSSEVWDYPLKAQVDLSGGM